jgi:type I restriction enzyme S subunit
VPEGIPEVRGEALTSDGFIEQLDDERYISQETNAQFPRTQLEVGDIVMSVRGTMGKVGLVEERYAGANITANLLRLSPDRKRVTGEFLRWLMRSTYFNEVLNSSAPQTTIKTITMPQLARLRIVLPPISEQHTICKFLDAKIAEIKRMAAVIEEQIKTLLAYRKSLIHECVTGQRRVTEADVRRVVVAG